MMKTRFSACAAAVPNSTRAAAAITKRMKSPQTGQNAREFGHRHQQCDGRVKLALTERRRGAGRRCLDAKPVLDHCAAHERPNHHLRHLPGDYELATTLAAAVFISSSRPTDARPAGCRRIMRFDAMDLKLYDTLTREKRVFKPLDSANVRMYVCGPTVYDFAHIGNARPVIVFDVLFRLLRHIYGADHVTYVRNITDVDDKINARAAEEYPDLPLNEAIRKVTEKTDRQFHEDVAALGCLPPTVEPRATEHIAEMKKIISRLIKSKRAYRFKDHVLFRVKGLASYGKLSHRSLGDIRSSARGEV